MYILYNMPRDSAHTFIITFVSWLMLLQLETKRVEREQLTTQAHPLRVLCVTSCENSALMGSS